MHSQDERTMAMLAHGSALLNIITGFGGIIVALVIYLTQKEKSAWVAYHALQSLVFQIVTAVIFWMLLILGVVLTAVFIGICILPIAVIIGLGAVGYGCYGAYQVNQGREFKYPVIGDWAAGTQPPTGPTTPPVA